jgi:hypothetical protein
VEAQIYLILLIIIYIYGFNSYFQIQYQKQRLLWLVIFPLSLTLCVTNCTRTHDYLTRKETSKGTLLSYERTHWLIEKMQMKWYKRIVRVTTRLNVKRIFCNSRRESVVTILLTVKWCRVTGTIWNRRVSFGRRVAIHCERLRCTVRQLFHYSSADGIPRARFAEVKCDRCIASVFFFRPDANTCTNGRIMAYLRVGSDLADSVWAVTNAV